MILIFDQRIDLILMMALALILSGVVYAFLMLIISRFEPRGATGRAAEDAASSDYHIIFMVPCLNEEAVIGTSVERLLTLRGSSLDVLVIDDGSDDRTATIVQEFDDPRVHLLQRVAPNARQGKGEALNEAYRHIISGQIRSDLAPKTTLICVVDADGRLESQTLEEVLPLFGSPDLGAVQIGVRINNRHKNMLARMQDLEFVLYTDVFQRGRRHFGSVGLGGNGQFVRLAALSSLGPRPWTRNLTEDLDLGMRLHLDGWDINFCWQAAVHQQGLVGVGRWIRQRTRWFQGHLQCWPLVPWVLRNLRGFRRADVLYHITSPYLLLVGSLLTVAFGLWILRLVLAAATGNLEYSWWWLTAYLVAFGPALAFGYVYRKRERDHGISLPFAVFLMHIYVLYSTLWYVAGWVATYRALLGRSSWSKTQRLVEHSEEDVISSESSLSA